MLGKFRLSFIVSLLLFVLFPVVIFAQTEELTYNLREAKTNHQFIISSDHDDFEVSMVTPDGTSVDPDDFDENLYMYFSLENERIWAVQTAEAGTYTFIVSTSEESRFRVRTKDSIDRPTIEWQQPFSETITISNDEAIELTWEVSGELESRFNRMQVVLTHVEGWRSLVIGEPYISDETYTLTLPTSIPSGDYALYIMYEDPYVEETHFDPEVTITYENDAFDLADVRIIDQEVRNGVLYVTVDIPKYERFNLFEARLVHSDGEQIIVSTEMDELILIESLEESDQYLWPVTALADEGTYEGDIIAVRRDNEFTEPVPLQPFDVKFFEFDEDVIEWSVEEGLTNATHVTVTVKEPVEGTYVTVVDDGVQVLHQEITDEQDQFSIPLREGYRVIEVMLSDNDQNDQIYTRHFQVDHTPPHLEMIHPLPTQREVSTPYASGYVEENSTLIINGDEVDYDESGYFLYDDFGRQLEISLTDASGNAVEYTWQPTESSEKRSLSWLWIVLINGIIIGGTVGYIFYLKKTRKN